MHISDIIGTIAAIAMVFGYLPQTVRTIRTRSTDDIAMGTFLMMGLGSAAFAVQGILTHNIPLFATNLLTTTMSNMKPMIASIRAKHPEAKVVVGGAPLNAQFAAEIGADAYVRDPQDNINWLNSLVS